MLTFSEVSSLKEYLQGERGQGKSIALIPTMGALHEGHLSLMRQVEADLRVVSIFVNPLQFNEASDFEHYPRELEKDLEVLESEGVDVVFTPSVEEMYPDGATDNLKAGSFAQGYEGEHRPGHFDGVVKAVNALFEIVSPDIAIFGEKDFQQLAVIRQMAEERNFDIEIIGGKLVREEDGLAMSSRNARLSEADRVKAVTISKALFAIQESFAQGESGSSELLKAAEKVCKSCEGFDVEYIDIINPNSFQAVLRAEKGSRVIIAAHVGEVRLIDNIEL